MKKIIVLLVIMATVTAVHGQAVDTTAMKGATGTPAINSEIVDQRQMQGFEQNYEAIESEIAKIHRLKTAGWVLLPAGVALMGVGIPVAAINAQYLVEDRSYSPDAQVSMGLIDLFKWGIGASVTSLGASATVAGIVCLGIGYSREKENEYLKEYGIKQQQKEAVRIDLQSSNDGIGFAIKF